jgi:hypothetical protein
MNNTTKRNLALAAVFMAATLVIGTFATTATTQSAFAYYMKKKTTTRKTRKSYGRLIKLAQQNIKSPSGKRL